MLKPNSKKILFLVHEASYTGAPILLLNLLRILKTNSLISFNIIILRGGPLESAFRELSPIVVLKQTGYSNLKGLKWFKEFCRNKLNIAQTLISALRCDLIFSNSVVNSAFLRLLSVTFKPTITYVHELENVIREFAIEKNGKLVLVESSVFLYPCETVHETLQFKYGIPLEKLKRLNYYIPFETGSEYSSSLRNNWDIKERDFAVCAVGNASLRKGTDIFIEIAKQVCLRTNIIKFVWVGGFETQELEKKWKETVKSYELGDRFLFTGSQTPSDMKNIYAAFDILFLSSREDPYPLVVLESAWNNIPSLAFKESGGIAEFINNDAGWLVNNFSIKDAADKIIYLSKHKEEIIEKGKKARERVNAWHGDQLFVVNQLNEAINFTISEG